MKKTKVIMMDIPWDTQYGQQVRRGIYRYVRPRKPWVFANIDSYDRSNKWLRYPDTVGLISMCEPRNYAAACRRYGFAAVGIGARPAKGKFSDFPYVGIDPKAIGEMAAVYFIERGFRHFGMITLEQTGLPMTFFARYRDEAFVAALKRRKLTCDVFDPEKQYPPCGEPLPVLAAGAERTRRWLMSLPRPLAVFAVDDSMALWVCEVCWWTDVLVPEEVAVLGVEDDGVFCGMANPHLSSIKVPAELVGYESAQLLDDMIHHRKIRKRPVLFPPVGVITRQSTDVMAIEDSYVTRAVRFIQEHACEGIRVEHVTSAVHMSRRTLEQRFQAALNRSPFAEIRRVQIERVMTLLAQTDDTLEAMAPECGFDSVTRMSMAFKKDTGMPPGAYRRQFRSR